tara:strand:- start:87 stop:290 length:204 start_codon:yes stop_codon:yes gene_type:complete
MKEEINKAFFEDLHQIQKNQINTSAIDDARKVILKLITQVSGRHSHDSSEADDAVLDALQWLKNNVS